MSEPMKINPCQNKTCEWFQPWWIMEDGSPGVEFERNDLCNRHSITWPLSLILHCSVCSHFNRINLFIKES